jgi:hypothetical protein
MISLLLFAFAVCLGGQSTGEQRRSEDCGFDRPASINPSRNSGGIDETTILCPLLKGFGDSINREHVIDTGIRQLFAHGGPAAVSGFIVSIVVDAVNTVSSGWSWTHVEKKIGEAVDTCPSIADCNASSPITWPSGRFAITATTPHVLPRAVFGSRSMSSSSVPQGSLARLFSVVAPTRHNVSEAQRGGLYNLGRRTAVALDAPTLFPSVVEYYQTPDAPTAHINQVRSSPSRHGTKYTIFSEALEGGNS